MIVRRHLQKVYEHYRPIVRYILRKKIRRGEATPEYVAFGLYSIFGIPYRYDGLVLTGPVKIGKIDLGDIGFYGRGIIDRFDPEEAGYLLSDTLHELSSLIDQSAMRYTAKYFGFELSKRLRDVQRLENYIEQELSETPYSPNIHVFDDGGYVEIEILYAIPIADLISLMGSFFIYSLAGAFELTYSMRLFEEIIYSEDEFRAVGVFEVLDD